MNAREELDKLENELDEFCGPREKRVRELRAILDKEFIEEQQKFYNDTVAGRLFYSNKEIWSGFENSIYVVKPVNCEDWSHYNSCNILQMEIRFSKGMKKFEKFSLTMTTSRVDCFKTHYKELPPEMLEQFKEMVDKEVINSFLNFKVG